MKIQAGNFENTLQLLKGVKAIEPVVGDKSSSVAGGVSGGNNGIQSFGDMLIKKYEETNTLGVEAERTIQRSILGEDQNPHEAVIAIQKASVSLSLMMGVKERLERAYQEIIRTPL
ncbi:MAG TPA: flagellar hook-basal body complex protein FliE [Oligoflexia bacterium]|nr:flagellar hook-basal body complex protein FliE [Oligoflexia bacterium]HMP47581.1 flagellar hook-basal body complex protein FliE [Oligoflexia bacterium]